MSQGFQSSIRLKLTAVVAGLVLVTVLSLSVVAYLFARRTLYDQINARLQVMALDRQKLVLHYIQQQEERINLIASRRLWRDYLGHIAAGQTPPEKLREDTQKSLMDSLIGVPGLRAVWIVDLTGHVLLATDPAVVGRDFSQSIEFKDGLQGVAFRLEDDDPSDDTIMVTAPALVGSNRVVGVVFMLVEQEGLLEVVKDRTGMGQTGEVMLGVLRGDKVQYLLETDVRRRALQRATNEVPAMAAAIRGETGFLTTRDYRGITVLAAHRPLGYRNLGLVTKIDETEVYAPIRSLRNMFIIVEVAVFGLLLLSSYLLATRVTRPILRMAKMAESIAGGGLRAQVVVESSDEIGHLATTFNRMSEELAHSHALLEQQVSARTAELQAERDLLRELMDHTPDRIYFKDTQSRFVRANRALAGFFGRTVEQTVGKTDFDMFTEEHARQAYEDEQTIIRTGQPVTGVEEKETWADGRITWASTTKAPWRDAAGQIIGTFGISRDITDRKRAEEELNRYFELSPDLFCIADTNGYFRRLSPAWTNVLGYTIAELMARPFVEFIHPDDVAATQAQYTRLKGGSRVVQFDNRYRCKDNSYRWLQWNAILLEDQNVIHAVARDVSENKRAQELLAGFADALNRKNQEMQEDLKLAREVHQVFISQDYPPFPAHVPVHQSLLRFAHRYLPTSALGGDFFDILTVSGHEAGVLICDVMGHGMRAALVTSIIRGLVDKYRSDAGDPSRFLGELNRGLLSNLKTVSTTIFATACYSVIDVRTGRIRSANAGHPEPLLLRPTAKIVELLGGTGRGRGPALGLTADAVYEVTTEALSAHDRLLLFTDGIYEVEGRDGEQFGQQRLVEAVRRRLTSGNLALLDELLLETRQYSAGGDFTDDVCLVGVELVGLAGIPAASSTNRPVAEIS